MQASTIDEVIVILENIIQASKSSNDPLGYFAVLYQKVTIKIKEGIENNLFENGPRMEKLDVVFANRYLEAYTSYQKKEMVTESWKKAFELSTDYWLIVLQHLLMGINAHINLDLGIAAMEITRNTGIDDLENDFSKINEILSSLVNDVQHDLAKIWPTLLMLLKKAKKVDDFLIDFSMELARDGAWNFAKSIANQPTDVLASLVRSRDEKVAKNAEIIVPQGIIVKVIMGIIRIGERGSVSEKIEKLKK
ncbi:MAG: DUF5995 family protein [Cyclobacteriaceae bacterium]